MLTEPRVMSPESCLEFKKAYLTYRSCLNQLAIQALDARQCRYMLHPKMHQLGHLVYHFLPVNPQHMSNYLDEDFVNKTKRLAEKAHPLHMPMHVLMKYSIAVTLRWSGLC